MFIIFVAITLVITYWAAMRTKTATDFYAAGRGITGLQNGMAIAGDYMSAASFLGIAALVYFNGFYGLIFSVGWLVGWPIILFLIAERLRNLGKFTYADVASFRLQQGPVRTMAAIGSLIVVIWYLIGQAVGRRTVAAHAGAADLLPGVHRHRRCADHHLRDLRRHEGHHLGADHQGRPAARRRHPDGDRGHGARRLQLQQALLRRGRSSIPSTWKS